MSEDTRPVQLASLRKRVQELQHAAHQLEVELKAIEAGQPGSLDDGSPPLDLPGINRALKNLATCSTQEAILDTFLEEVRQYLDRAVLFLETDGKYAPWKSLGFVPESIEEVVVDSPGDPVTRAARELRIIYLGEQLEESFPWLINTGYVPQAAICLPVKVGDSIPLVLYADANHPIAIDSLELLTHLTELVVKNHFLSYIAASEGDTTHDEQATSDSAATVAAGPEELAAQPARDFESVIGEEPSARDDEWKVSETGDLGSLESELVAESEDASQAGTTPAGEFIFGEPVEETPAKESDQPAADFEIKEPVEGKADETKVEAGEGSFQAGSERDIRSLYRSDEASTKDDEASTKDIEAPAPPESDIDQELVSEESVTQTEEHPEETTSLVMEPSSPPDTSIKEDSPSLTEHVSPPEEPLQQEEQEAETSPADSLVEPTPEPVSFSSSQEEAIHREAQRFARLLVSEIKLYNEEEVERGRQDGALYSRLQKDIDRSRQMYQKRVHPSVKSNADYFHNELIRILARNDGKLLGPDYPGPQLVGSTGFPE